ncbi:MAG: NAD(P)-dependent oxidoreductase, partial [Thermodesulfobacteriota bacterium]
MKIFITGGSGFIGRQLAKALADRGHQITILSRSPRKGPSKNI